MTLFDHALLLHREDPDSPLPRDGEPFRDDSQHRGQPAPKRQRIGGLKGLRPPPSLTATSPRPSAVPAELAQAFHDV